MNRTAYLAGTWYPARPDDCRAAIEQHALETSPRRAQWRGLIAPHAGWFYSGNAMGHTYRWLAEAQPDPDLVVIFGSHRGPRGPNTVFLGEGWETPLGTLTCAQTLAEKVAAAIDASREPEQPRSPDNAVEVQLPFIRFFFPKAELLMVGVAAAPTAIDIGTKVAQMCVEAKRNVVFIGSTDLTHYGPNYDFTPKGSGPDAQRWVRTENDAGFIEKILKQDALGVVRHAATNQSACCPGAVAAAMTATTLYGGSTEVPALVEHYLSCDVQPAASFVGYAGVVL